MRPDVTVGVLVTRGIDMVGPCVSAIERARVAVPCSEVVVVLASDDPDTRVLVSEPRPGWRVIEAPIGLNVGLSPAQNLVLAIARSPYVVLLHEDSRPAPDAFAALLAAARERPDAGVIGARLTDAHGDLAQAGAVVWGDGRVSALTEEARELLDRGAPFAVDACGMAGTLVSRLVWEDIGGFDERYFPAFYGDIDFCLASWGHGHPVVCAPHAVVEHEREAMLDPGRGAIGTRDMRAFLLARHRARFLEKWREGLGAFEPMPAALAAAEPTRQMFVNAMRRSERRQRDGAGLPRLATDRAITAGAGPVLRIDPDLERRLVRAQAELLEGFGP